MKKLNYLLILLGVCLLLNFSCQTKDSPEPSSIKDLKIDKQAVIGGNTININDAPYQAAVFINNGEAFGGAVILNNEWILTAAHNLFDRNTFIQHGINNITVRTGNTNINNTTSHAISQIIIHPDFVYNPQVLNDNDIALLRLTTPLTYSNTIQPINIAHPIDALSVNDIVNVSGWGGTVCNNLNPQPSTILKRASIQISDLSNPNVITSNISGPSAFRGDSGGPLVRF